MRDPQTKSGLLGPLLCGCLAMLCGCYRAHILPTEELERLSGFDGRGSAPAPHVTDTEGRTVTFEPGSRLFLQVRGAAQRGGRFERIEIRDGVIWGRMRSGDELIVAVPAVRYARLERYSPGRTAALVLGLLLPAAAAAVITPLVLRQPR
jgi:hypothetical protein